MAPKGAKKSGKSGKPGEADASPAGGSPDASSAGDTGAAAKKRKLEDGQEALGGAEKEEVKDKKEKKDKKDKKDKKEKKEKKEKEEKAEESDEEYPDCDLSSTPQTLQVKNSGHSKIDGEYHRLEKPSRGRPAYEMQREGKKPVYLFWYKSKKWLFSPILGGHKNLARVDDTTVEGRKQPPCEPYPFSWKVMKDEAKDKSKEKSKDKDKEKVPYQVMQPMRIINAATLNPKAETELGGEPDAVGAREGKKRRTPRPTLSSTSASSPTSSKTNSKAGAAGAAASPAAGGASKERDEDAEMIANMAGGDSDSDEDEEEAEAKSEAAKSEKESDSSNSDSDSDSDKSSSSAPGSPVQPKAAAPAAPAPAAPAAKPAKAPPATPPASAQPAEDPQEKDKKREAFVGKLRMQLQKITDLPQRYNKLKQVKDMLKERAEHLQKVAGMNTSEVKALMDSLDNEFGPKANSAKRKPGQQGGQAAPSTPPEKRYAGAGNPAWRLPCQSKSALKRKNKDRFGQRGTPRISWPQQNAAHHVPVECFRGLGEQLWFHMPGAYVACDVCEKSVPQSMGALQGEPQRPQFAQCQFLCSECIAQQMAGQQLGMGYQP